MRVLYGTGRRGVGATTVSLMIGWLVGTIVVSRVVETLPSGCAWFCVVSEKLDDMLMVVPTILQRGCLLSSSVMRVFVCKARRCNLWIL